MSDPTKLQLVQPTFVRKTRVGHGAPLPEVAPGRKTKVGVPPPPRPQPPVVPPEAKAQRAAPKPTAAPILLTRRKEDDAFSARVSHHRRACRSGLHDRSVRTASLSRRASIPLTTRAITGVTTASAARCSWRTSGLAPSCGAARSSTTRSPSSA